MPSNFGQQRIPEAPLDTMILEEKMASNLPIVKQINILSIFVQILLLSIISFGFYQIDKTNYIFYSLGTFFILMLILRYLVPRDHRKGVSLYKKQCFSEAIPYFEKSYLFFTSHNCLDKYRFITMLSSSKISYTEMALLNKAFCLGQVGKKDESIAAYKKVLDEFSDSKIAESALRMME